MAPRVSVIIPCYNDGSTLPETLHSVLAQDESIEVVVINDGSTDAVTLELFDLLERDEPLVRVIHQENTGLAGARRKGTASTSAPFIYPLDADDVLLPGALRALADALEANPEAGLAYGDFLLFGEREKKAWTLPYFCPWLLTYRNTVPVGSLIRRRALEGTEQWQTRHYEDWDLWLSLADKGWGGIKVDRDIFRYRVRQGLFSESVETHAANVAVLANRHPRLFAQRRANKRCSPAPRPIKILLPLIEHLPLPPTQRSGLSGLILGACHHPLLPWRRRRHSKRNSSSTSLRTR